VAFVFIRWLYKVVFAFTKTIRYKATLCYLITNQGPSWPRSYGSWIYNYMYLCNQHISPLMLWVRISIRASCTTLC